MYAIPPLALSFILSLRFALSLFPPSPPSPCPHSFITSLWPGNGSFSSKMCRKSKCMDQSLWVLKPSPPNSGIYSWSCPPPPLPPNLFSCCEQERVHTKSFSCFLSLARSLLFPLSWFHLSLLRPPTHSPIHSLTHWLTHSLLYSPTQSRTHAGSSVEMSDNLQDNASCNHSPTHSRTHAPTHPLTHSPTHPHICGI